MSAEATGVKTATETASRRTVGRPATARSRGSVKPVAVANDGLAPSRFKSTPDCELINSLARGLQVLATFGPDQEVLGNKDIAARTGIPKPSVSRLTDTLLKLNFLDQDAATGLYRLGNAATALGLSVRKTIDLPGIARPFLEQFALQHDVSVHLGTLDGLEVRASAISAGNSPVGLRFGLGASCALDGTALGYGILAGLEAEVRAELLARLKIARGAEWAEASTRIEAALQEYSEHGYATSIGEWSGVVNALGAPLSLPKQDLLLSISCCGFAQTFTPARIWEISPYFMGLVGSIKAAARQRLIR